MRADPTASALFLGAFFDELERWGVHDVVVSPGSRSTPLAMTAYELSRRFPDRLRLFVDVDERGAAFFALGLAKASGQPAAVICTSGTAVANYYPAVLEADPQVSVVIPLFSEDYSFVEERLPLILAQNYPDFEVVIVYVGHDSDFYEELVRLKQSFPQIVTTKIHLDPRFPISRKMALNVGIKSAHHECMVFTSTDAVPQTDRWLALMAKGFTRGEIVVGYCGVERGKGFANYMMRAWRMMHGVDWIARAVRRNPYRGTLHNIGFTKNIYFGSKGFSHLNMNIGEDDLYMQKVMTHDNVSVILSPRATLREKMWGGMRWWMGQLRYYGSAFPFYPQQVKNYIQWELGSRALFFITAACALAVMPFEYKIAALVLVLVRYLLVAIQVRRIARRLGEAGMAGCYFVYDLLSPLWAFLLGVMLLRRDDRVWR